MIFGRKFDYDVLFFGLGARSAPPTRRGSARRAWVANGHRRGSPAGRLVVRAASFYTYLANRFLVIELIWGEKGKFAIRITIFGQLVRQNGWFLGLPTSSRPSSII